MYFAKRQFDPFDQAAAHYFDVVDNEFFFHAIRTGEIVLPYTDALFDKDVKDTCDFWSINIYTRSMVDMRKANHERRTLSVHQGAHHQNEELLSG